MTKPTEDSETSDYSSPGLNTEQYDSLDRYVQRLRYEAVTPREWLQQNATLNPSTGFRQILWSHYVIAYPPPRIPKFTIVDVLGEGGMGRVYLAREEALNRLVAIKELTETLRRGDSNSERFRREAEILARLEHPNIVKIYQWISHDDREYIAMEYLSNGTLNDRLSGSLDLNTTLPKILALLARAVDFTHGEKIIHRDLKPSNILFDKHNVPKLSDFGLAKDLGDPTDRSQGAILGTHHYMSPEQVDGRLVGPGTDIWAFGVILFRLLNGYFPFEGSSVKELHQAIRAFAPKEFAPEIPDELRRICLKCLEKESDQRYQRGNDLADDLEKTSGLARHPFFQMLGRRKFLAAGTGVAMLGAIGMAVPSVLRQAGSSAPGKFLTMQEKLPGPSQSIAFMADGNFGLSEVAGSKFLVWDLRKGQLVRTVDHGFEQDGLCGSVVASGDGRIIAALGTNIVLDRQELSFLELFDTKTFDKLLVKNSSFGRSIAISPDNQRIAVETFGTLALFARVMGGHGEAYLSIFDVASKEWARHIPLKTPMTCSAFSPDGKLILTGSTDPSMIVWDLAKRAETREIAVPDGGVDEIVFSPDGSRIFTASLANNLLSIHKSSGETEKTIATTTQVPGKMSCAALNREGKGVTGHRDGSVVYWDLTTGISGTFRNDGTEVVAVAISRDGRKALASLLNRSVVCYELPMSNP